MHDVESKKSHISHNNGGYLESVRLTAGLLFTNLLFGRASKATDILLLGDNETDVRL